MTGIIDKTKGWTLDRLSGTDATEAKVTVALADADIAHIATHGFFIDPADTPAADLKTLLSQRKEFEPGSDFFTSSDV